MGVATQKNRERLEEISKLAELAGTWDDLEFLERSFLAIASGAKGSAPRKTILTVRAGTGGKEAKAWAYTLLRMYEKWGRKTGFGPEILSWDEEAPGLLKEASLLMGAPPERMRGERGVHRLTRISPFCSQNKPQTSFALVEVEPEPNPRKPVNIPDKDIRTDVFRAGGPGGQGVNTTDSAVRVVHKPTGITAVCQSSRSQQKNRAVAAAILCQRVEEALAEKMETRRAGKGWGVAIRSYVLNGKARVRDHRSGKLDSRPLHVLEGNIEGFLEQ